MTLNRPELGNLKRYRLTDQAERCLKDLYKYKQATDVRTSHSSIVCDALSQMYDREIGAINMSDVLSDYIANKNI